MAQTLTPGALVYDLATAGDPQVSPDGARVVYSLGKADRERKKVSAQVWVSQVDGSNARRLTWSGERNGGVRWSPDGKAIAFVSDRVKKAGIFVLPLDGGEARELTRHGQAIHDLAWSPGGDTIAYTTLFDPENPDEQDRPADAAPRVRATRRIDYKQDNRGYLGDARLQVFVVDVATGERRRVTSAPVDHNLPAWSPDGRRLAVAVPNRNGMCSQLGLIDVASGATALIGTELGIVGCWAWSPNGDRILFAGEATRTWQLDFFVYSVVDGRVRRLTDDLVPLPDSGFPTIAPPSQPFWLDDHRVLFHAFRAGASGLYLIDSENGRVEPVHEWQALHAGMSVDAAGRYVVQSHTSLEAVGEVSVFDLAEQKATLITANNTALLRDRPAAT